MKDNFGVRLDRNCISFTFVFSGENPRVNLYDKVTKKLIKTLVPKEEDIKGRVCTVSVLDIDPNDIVYLYEWDEKEYLDPYSTEILGREIWAKPDKKLYSKISTAKNGEIYKGEPLSDLIIYRVHMRGLTMDKRIGESSKGNYKGIIGSIPYFKKIGINALSFFPLYEFSEINKDKTDYWGYGGADCFLMAPKSSYFGEDAIKNAIHMVKSLHNSGISLIVDFCFNKNNLFNNDLIISALMFWAFNIGVDGFRFLGDAVPFDEIKNDPYLANKILIFENYVGKEDINDKDRLLISNDDFLYPMRKLINHMDVNAPTICGLMRRQGVNFSYINYVAAPNGFTLADSVSYRDKHNEDNGENNTDGTNYNYSDNCGIEGDTRDKSVLEERLNRIRAALMLLMMSQSVPMINAGDEFLNSQKGNNNPYCQDNRVGWVNYTKKKDALLLLEYFENLCAFRKNHPALHNPSPFKMNDFKKVGIPDISYHSREPWVSYLDESKKAVGILISGSYVEPSHEDVMILINYHNSKEQFTLPSLNDKKWYFIANSMDFTFEKRGKKINGKGVVTVPGDSVTLLVAK